MRTLVLAASLSLTVLVALGAALGSDATEGTSAPGDAAAVAGPPRGPPVFGAPVTLDPAFVGGEPNVVVDGDGRIYVAAVGSPSAVWRSDDGGATFARVADVPGHSGDTDIAVDDDGTVYVSDLFIDVPVSASFDHGASYAHTTPAGPGDGFEDRQWMAADGSGTVYVTWKEGGVRLSVSHDGGLTWPVQGRLLASANTAGPIHLGPDGSLTVPYTRDDRLDLLRSADGGATWTSTPVASGTLTNYAGIFPVSAVDDEGNLYVAWSERVGRDSLDLGAVPRLKLAVSTDGGATFGAPVQLSSDASQAIFPWVVAGSEGRVAVFWLDGVAPVPVAGAPDLSPGVQWYLRTAQSLDAHRPSPTFQSTLVVPDVVHTGSVCIACYVKSSPTLLVPGVVMDRRMLDFFEAAVDTDGRAVVTWTQDLPLEDTVAAGTSMGHTVSVHFAKQTGGPKLR